MAVAGQGVLDEDDVVARVVEPAPRLVGDADVGQHAPALELHVTDVGRTAADRRGRRRARRRRAAPCGTVGSSLWSAVTARRCVVRTRRCGAAGRPVPAVACRARTTRALLPVGDGHRGTPRSSRLHAPGTGAARSSPGAPHREGGLPTSEPGLVAGTHDLRQTIREAPPGARSAGPRHGRHPPAPGPPVVRRSADGRMPWSSDVAHQPAQPVVRLELERVVDGDAGPRPVAAPPRERRDDREQRCCVRGRGEAADLLEARRSSRGAAAVPRPRPSPPSSRHRLVALARPLARRAVPARLAPGRQLAGRRSGSVPRRLVRSPSSPVSPTRGRAARARRPGSASRSRTAARAASATSPTRPAAVALSVGAPPVPRSGPRRVAARGRRPSGRVAGPGREALEHDDEVVGEACRAAPCPGTASPTRASRTSTSRSGPTRDGSQCSMP